MVAKITAMWEVFRHDGTGVVIGQEPYKTPSQYAHVFNLTRGKIRIICVTDDHSIGRDDAANFARALMSGQLKPKTVEGLKGETPAKRNRSRS